jgi:hypothetical protein
VPELDSVSELSSGDLADCSNVRFCLLAFKATDFGAEATELVPLEGQGRVFAYGELDECYWRSGMEDKSSVVLVLPFDFVDERSPTGDVIVGCS